VTPHVLLVALTLNVPFLPQTPALCGGAAVAMVFRYYGDRHADVQQFEPLVDRRQAASPTRPHRSGTTAAGERRVEGSIACCGIISRRAALVLLPDRQAVPTSSRSAPTRRVSFTIRPGAGGVCLQTLRRWAAARTDAAHPSPRAPIRSAAWPHNRRLSLRKRDDRLLDRPWTRSAVQVAIAEETLSRVMRSARSPRRSGELAAIRFAQERWDDAQPSRNAVARSASHGTLVSPVHPR
jgi:hypothetical protein